MYASYAGYLDSDFLCAHIHPSVPGTLTHSSLSCSSPQLNAKLQELEEAQCKLLEENSEVNWT